MNRHELEPLSFRFLLKCCLYLSKTPDKQLMFHGMHTVQCTLIHFVHFNLRLDIK